MLRQELDEDVEVAEDVVDVAGDLPLLLLHHLVEPTEQMVVYIEQQLDAPLLLVRQHCLYQLVRFVNDSKFSQFGEAQFFGLHERLHHDDRVLVQIRMVHLVEVSDELKYGLRIGLCLLGDCVRSRLTGSGQVAQDLDQASILVKDGAEESLAVEGLWVALAEEACGQR
mmetsp:Transcript_14429/g.19549  ORF Transcript_14429/g.19549 Transcript_14429/m.19549 type:complete len:169 (-) Transcript_14429:289-795(-)